MSRDKTSGLPEGLMPLATREALTVPTARAQAAAKQLLGDLMPSASSNSLGKKGVQETGRDRQVPVREYPEAFAYARALGLHVRQSLQDDSKHRPALNEPTKLAVVRRGVSRKDHSKKVPQQLLEQIVSSLQLAHTSGAAPRFDLAFEDEQLGPLACAVRLESVGLMATFYAQDGHTARLLEAERHRLIAQLEAQGLKVAAVEIEVV